jgi:hypothetical protein
MLASGREILPRSGHAGRHPQGLAGLIACGMVAWLSALAVPEATASAELFNANCARCHNDVDHPYLLVFNAAGNQAVLDAVNAAGMGATGSAADFASIVAYLDQIKPVINMAPVPYNSAGTVINLRDIKVQASDVHAFLKIIAGIETVTPPTKGTVTYRFASSFLAASSVTYTPFPGATGVDTWTYRGRGDGANAGITTSLRTASVVIGSPAGAPDYSDMWWAGQAENGWGMSIQQHGNLPFIALYVYDAAGKPTWYVVPNGTWNADYSVFTGALYQPTSAPLNAYTPAQFVVGASPGNITLTFSNISTATLQYTINGVSGQKSLSRQSFGSGTSPLTVGDMWWAGTAQDGWGINLVQHQGIVFGVWYTYGPDGKPTWYVLPNGSWNGTTYAGPFYSTIGSSWLGVPYDATKLGVTLAGTLTLGFTDANNATMGYSFTSGPFAGTTQSKSIVRMSY